MSYRNLVLVVKGVRRGNAMRGYKEVLLHLPSVHDLIQSHVHALPVTVLNVSFDKDETLVIKVLSVCICLLKCIHQQTYCTLSLNLH